MEPVHVLHRVDRPHHARLVDLVGQWRLHQNPVDEVVLVEMLNQLDELVLSRCGRKPVVDRLDACFVRGLVLEPDIDLGRRVVSDEHSRQAHVAELRNLLLDLLTHPCRQGGTVHQRGIWHYGIVSSTPLTSRPSYSARRTPSSRSSRRRSTSRDSIARPIQARSRGRHNAWAAKTGNSRLAASTSFWFIFF